LHYAVAAAAQSQAIAFSMQMAAYMRIRKNALLLVIIGILIREINTIKGKSQL
jgi:hypothetical protein